MIQFWQYTSLLYNLFVYRSKLRDPDCILLLFQQICLKYTLIQRNDLSCLFQVGFVFLVIFLMAISNIHGFPQNDVVSGRTIGAGVKPANNSPGAQVGYVNRRPNRFTNNFQNYRIIKTRYGPRFTRYGRYGPRRG